MHRHAILAAALAGAGLAAIPAGASAHTMAVACDTATGRYVVTADYQHLNPVTTIGATTATTVWSDGYRVTRPLPKGCTPPTTPPGPTPPPTPPIPEEEPPPAEVIPPPPPPVVTCGDLLDRYPLAGPKRRAAWGCPVQPRKTPTPKPRPKPRVVTCSFVLSHYSGAPRARMIARHGLPATCGRPYNPPVAG